MVTDPPYNVAYKGTAGKIQNDNMGDKKFYEFLLKSYADRKQRTTWNFDRPTKSELHPTMKPLNLIAYPIQNPSLNCIVPDPFGGSGSALIACEQTKRIYYTIELDEKYYNGILCEANLLFENRGLT